MSLKVLKPIETKSMSKVIDISKLKKVQKLKALKLATSLEKINSNLMI